MIIDAAIAALDASAAVLLLASGVAKLGRPQASAAMLGVLLASVLPRAPRRPAVLRPLARFVGAGEVAVGAAAVVLGGRVPALLLALAYASFTVVALRLARGPGRVSCGCFGRDDTPVTSAHVVLTVLASVVAAAGVVRGLPAAGGLSGQSLPVVLAAAALIVLLAWTAYLSITALPALSAARAPLEVS